MAKKVTNSTSSYLLIAILGLLAACQSPSSSGSSKITSTPVTEGGSLDGTWVYENDVPADDGIPAYHLTTTWTIDGNSWTREEFQDYAEGSGHADTYDWDRGTLVYRSSDNAVLMTSAQTVDDESNAAPEESDWVAVGTPYVFVQRNIVTADGTWYPYAYLRVGPGTDILGTWDILENDETQESERERIAFSSNGTYTIHSYSVVDGDIGASNEDPEDPPPMNVPYTWNSKTSKLTFGNTDFAIKFFADAKYLATGPASPLNLGALIKQK